MSSTNLAYAVIGIRIPVTHLFAAGARHLECNYHGSQTGNFCSACGRELEERFEKVYSTAMIEAAKHYGCEPGALWDLMLAKRDTVGEPIPLAWWRSNYNYDRNSHWDLTDEDKVVLGILIATTPFVGVGNEYPVADVGIGHLLEVARTAEKELAHFRILGKPQLFVFAYC